MNRSSLPASHLVLGCALALGTASAHAVEPLDEAQLRALQLPISDYVTRPPPIDPQGCDMRHGPHVPVPDEHELDALVGALTSGRAAPDSWAACAQALWPGLRSEPQRHFLDHLVAAFDKFARSKRTATDPGRHKVLVALVDTLLARPATPWDPGRMREVVLRLGQAIDDGRLVDPTRAEVERFLESMGPDTGTWRGHVVVADTVDEIDDPDLLERIASLATTTPDVRALARRRAIELRSAAAPFAVVRANAALVADSLMTRGYWPLPEPFTVEAIDADLSHLRSLGVKAEPMEVRTALLWILADGSTEHDLDISDGVRVHVAGLEAPIGLCRPNGRPEPCIPSTSIAVEPSWVTLTDEGRLVLPGSLTPESVRDLAALDGVDVTLRSAEVRTTTSVSLDFLPPGAVLVRGAPGTRAASPGSRGPDVIVEVWCSGDRLKWTLAATGVTQVFWVDPEDVPAVSIATAGGDGANGAPGFPGLGGSPGQPGRSASCPYGTASNGTAGGDGEPGGPGGPGGQGGLGGNVVVLVHCTAEDCQPLQQIVLGAGIRSVGGHGGAGGMGGAGGGGGPGGRGGNADSCTTSTGSTSYMPAGLTGPMGSLGQRGAQGQAGSPGLPGTVDVRVTKDVGLPPVQSPEP